MKKIICMLLSICVVFTFLCGCEQSSLDNEINLNESPEQSQEEIFTNSNQEAPDINDTKQIELISENYEYNGLKLSYPQIKDNESVLNKLINSVIYEEIIKLEHYFDGINGVSLDLEYETNIFDEKILSVVYTMTAYSDEMIRPINLVYTTNVDLKSGKRIRLSSVLNINEKLVELIKSDKVTVYDESNHETIRSLDDNEILAKLNMADDTDGVSVNNTPKAYSCFDVNSVNIILFDDSFGVDYIEIKIPINVLSDILKR